MAGIHGAVDGPPTQQIIRVILIPGSETGWERRTQPEMALLDAGFRPTLTRLPRIRQSISRGNPENLPGARENVNDDDDDDRPRFALLSRES